MGDGKDVRQQMLEIELLKRYISQKRAEAQASAVPMYLPGMTVMASTKLRPGEFAKAAAEMEKQAVLGRGLSNLFQGVMRAGSNVLGPLAGAGAGAAAGSLLGPVGTVVGGALGGAAGLAGGRGLSRMMLKRYYDSMSKTVRRSYAMGQGALKHNPARTFGVGAATAEAAPAAKDLLGKIRRKVGKVGLGALDPGEIADYMGAFAKEHPGMAYAAAAPVALGGIRAARWATGIGEGEPQYGPRNVYHY